MALLSQRDFHRRVSSEISGVWSTRVRYFSNCSIPNHIVPDEQCERKGFRCRLWHNYNMYNSIYIYIQDLRYTWYYHAVFGLQKKIGNEIPPIYPIGTYILYIFYIIVIYTMSPKYYTIIYYNCSLIYEYYTRAHDMRILY